MIEITIKKKAVRGSIMKSTFPVIGDSSTVLISGIPLIKTATAGNIIVRADKKEKIEQTYIPKIVILPNTVILLTKFYFKREF